MDEGSQEGSQLGWRHCNKCEGFFFSDNPTTGYCPAGGGHEYKGSSNYQAVQALGPGDLPHNLPGEFVPFGFQGNWHWCHKCQGMFFAGDFTSGFCPAGGGHDHTGSSGYAMQPV
jgi:hypothetical protein